MVSRRPTSQAQSTRTTQVRGRGTSPLKVYAERMEDALNVIGRRDSPRKVANALSELCFMLDIVTSIYVTTNLEAERPVEDVPYDGFRDAMRLAAKRYGEFSIDKDPTGRLLSTKLATKSGR